MVWNITKDAITTRMAEVDHHTWAPPLASAPELPRDDDRATYSKAMHVPLEAMFYSGVLKEGTMRSARSLYTRWLYLRGQTGGKG